MTESASHEEISYHRVLDIVESVLERHLTHDELGVPEGVDNELVRQKEKIAIDENIMVLAFRYNLSSLVSLVGRDFAFLREVVNSCERCVTADVNLALFGVNKDNKQLAMMALDLLESEPPPEIEKKADSADGFRVLASRTLQLIKRLLKRK